MQPCTLIFFSTGEISIPLFEALSVDKRFKILGLICQPDRGEVRAIKKLAEASGIPVYQPEKLSKDEALLQKLSEERPDFLLTFSYGQILSEKWLNLAHIAPLNVHPSLLPKYRGPTPPQAALLNGDEVSGLSLIKMTKGMDEGPIAFQEKISIPSDMTCDKLFEAFAKLAAEKIPDAVLEVMEKRDAAFTEQDESQASYCKMTNREDGRIDFNESAEKIFNRFRAYSPWPGIFTTYEGKRLKLLDIEKSELSINVGKVIFRDSEVLIGTSKGSLKLKSVQLEGKKAVTIEAFLLGQPKFCDAQLPS